MSQLRTALLWLGAAAALALLAWALWCGFLIVASLLMSWGPYD